MISLFTNASTTEHLIVAAIFTIVVAGIMIRMYKDIVRIIFEYNQLDHHQRKPFIKKTLHQFIEDHDAIIKPLFLVVFMAGVFVLYKIWQLLVMYMP